MISYRGQRVTTHDHRYLQHPTTADRVFCEVCGFGAPRDLIERIGAASGITIYAGPTQPTGRLS